MKQAGTQSRAIAMTDLYEKDFYAWTQQTAVAIKNRQFDAVDWDNVVEEIESLGSSDRDKLISSLKVLIAHLLKWQYQPQKRSKSWEDTIFRERENIEEYLEDMPSLKQFLNSEEWLVKAYKRGRRIAGRETGLGEKVFPQTCPYSVEQIQNFDYLP